MKKLYDPERGCARGRKPTYEQGDIFTEAVRNARAAVEAGQSALALTSRKNEDTINLLIPLAEEIARKAGPGGVTVSDLRLYAVQRGVLTGEERGKALSFLGTVMKRAGLVNSGRVRRSPLISTHGIRQVVWVHSQHTGGSDGK